MFVFHVLHQPAAGFVRDPECISAAFIREIARNRNFVGREMDGHRNLFHHARIHGSDRIEADDVRGRRRNDDRVFREDVDEAGVTLVDAPFEAGNCAPNRRFIRFFPLGRAGGGGRV